MRIYTRTGDAGQTGLPGGVQTTKDDTLIECCGTIDELNCAVGMVRNGPLPEDLDRLLERIQHELFDLGAELARRGGRGTQGVAKGTVPDQPSVGARNENRDSPQNETRERPQVVPAIGPEHVRALEVAIDRYTAELPPLANFILPGGVPAAAALHFARAVCRRAERRLVTLTQVVELSPGILPYLNRLSDLLFTLARVVNARAGHGDVLWRKDRERK